MLTKPNTTPRRDLALLLFVLLLGTYAYFWQGRDWNNASRLMLTYALVDRGTLRIDGLEINAGNPAEGVGDLARTPDGHYYTDKAPGQSLLGVPVYALVKRLAGYPDHPLDLPQARAYWPRDYWVTVGTSGLATALLGVLLYVFFLRVGTSHSTAVLLAVAYALGTPALTYATLFYGHQSAALAATASFYLLYRAANDPLHRGLGRMLFAGLLAGWAVVVEFPMLLVCGILWAYALIAFKLSPGQVGESQSRCVGNALVHSLTRSPAFWLTAGMVTSGLVLLGYQTLAFGHPLRTGYSYEIYQPFREAHTGIGIGAPDWSVVPHLLFSLDRGLFVYAPVMLLALPACFALLLRRRWAVVVVPFVSFAALLLVNICHRLPDGGLATGPRFLLPAVPMLLIPVAAWFATLEQSGRLWATKTKLVVTTGLGGVGMIVILAATAIGGRLEPGDPNPWKNQVLPAWRDGEFTRNLGTELTGEGSSAPAQLIPLVLFWGVIGSVLAWRAKSGRRQPGSGSAGAAKKSGGSHAKRDKPSPT